MILIKVIGLTLFFIIIIYWQVRDLIVNKNWRELVVYSLLMSIAIIYSYGVIFDLPLFNPTKLLIDYYKPLYEYIFSKLS